MNDARRGAHDGHATATTPTTTRSRRTRWVGAAVGAALLVGVAFGVDRATAFDADDAVRVSEDRVRWRRWIAPRDAPALLAAAWHARRAGDLDAAWRGLRWAEARGISKAPAEELRAELAAEQGDCAAARAAFDRALRARALLALDAPTERLALGGYRLPPTLLRRCALDDP